MIKIPLNITTQQPHHHINTLAAIVISNFKLSNQREAEGEVKQ